MTLAPQVGIKGYYDDKGHWQRTKFCFVDCGDRCTCQPPMGRYYSAAHDKRTWRCRECGAPFGELHNSYCPIPEGASLCVDEEDCRDR